MTHTIAHPGTHISATSAAAVLAGALLAVGAGFGIASLVIDEATTTTSQVDTGEVTGNPGMGFSDPNGFAGTDRELRSFMHRN